MKRIIKHLLIRICTILRSRTFLKLVKLTSFAKLIAINDPNELRRVIRNWYQNPLKKYHEIEGCRFILDLNDHIGYVMYIKDLFDVVPIYTAKKLGLGKDDILLDIGANIGSVCIPIARKTGCSVVAIEASSRVVSQLTENISLNRDMKAMVIKGAALSHDSNLDEPVKLYHNPGNVGANSIFDTWNPSNLSEIQYEYAMGLTIDDLESICNFSRIKMIKLDVEGAEAIVLKGMAKLIEHGVPILFEYRIDAMRKYLDRGGETILAILEKHYTFHSVEVSAEGTVTLEDFKSEEPYANVLALGKGQSL